MNGATTAALGRALALSRDLLAAAEDGDSQRAVRLDAERLQLLKSASGSMAADDRALLEEIARLNDLSVGHLEHHRRTVGRQLDLAAVGRRAVAAYSGVRRQR
jgi:hypothetical protein